jgi:hypothetical protein
MRATSGSVHAPNDELELSEKCPTRALRFYMQREALLKFAEALGSRRSVVR